MQPNPAVAAIAIGIACLLSGSCVQTRPPQPNICLTTCTRVPTIEPLGKLCTLQSSSCKNGMRICIYHCEDIETREPIELEIRTRPRGPLLTDKYPADGG